MLLWLVFAVLSATVLAFLLWPLVGGTVAGARAVASGSAVYRDQLDEIEADRSRGLIGADEAEAARREVSRRLLASVADHASVGGLASVADDPARHPAGSPWAKRVAVALAALIPVSAIAIYLWAGAPGLPGQPLASRSIAPPSANAELVKMIAAVETRLRANPEDGRGWDVIAPVYLRMARYPEAADAFGRALRLLGEEPRRLAGFAEAAMLANGGRVTEAARASLEKLVRLEPGNVQASFWLAFANEQDGRLAEAAAEYQRLLANAPPTADWRPVLVERYEAVRVALADRGQSALPSKADPPATSSPAGPPATPGPSAADIAAAERLSSSERQAMIEGMVSGLAARLEQDGRDLAGWQRLIRALTVMGRREEAVAALGRARKSFDGEQQPLADLTELARSLGLGS